jgi:hypothetical protein
MIGHPLWRKVALGTLDHCNNMGMLPSHHLFQPKIGYFREKFIIQQDVLKLDVTVYNPTCISCENM